MAPGVGNDSRAGGYLRGRTRPRSVRIAPGALLYAPIIEWESYMAKMRFEIFEGDRRHGLRVRRSWFWRLRRANGKIVADGSESYVTASNARRAVKRLLAGLGVNVKGAGWRARLMRDHGVAITVKG